MKQASTKLVNSLLNDVEVRAYPKLTAEWNQNRYGGILQVDAVPSEANENPDLDSFPVRSVVEPNRPGRGIIKARTARTGSKGRTGGEEGFAAPRYSDRPGDVRYYSTGADSLYKYWSSTFPSGSFNNPQNVYGWHKGQAVFVRYKKAVKTNKLVIGFENTYSSPVNYRIRITTDGSTWTTVASNVPLNNRGQAIVWLQGNGSWTTARTLENTRTIRGVRVEVDDIDRPDSFLNIIEVSARLEKDLTQYVIGYNSEFNMAEPNFITPLGTASSNVGSVSLSNTEGTFNNDNTASPFYQLIQKNVEMRLDLEYVFPDNTTERVRQFTMYADEWTGPGREETTVELKDYSKFFQEDPCPEYLVEGVTVGEAIWRLCDAVGFTDYVYDRKDTDPATNLSYFYTNGEDTVWQVMQDLAKGTQTAVYFDEYGKLQIQTREAAFDTSAPITWNFDATNNNGKLADIQEATSDYEFQANSVNINYKTTKISDFQNGLPKMEVVWEPEQSLVLRSSNLKWRLSANNRTSFVINAEDAITWPYEGMVEVGGELIRYAGKDYRYFAKDGTQKTETVYSKEGQDVVDNSWSDPYKSYKNGPTGAFRIIERGVYWTAPQDHEVNIPNFQSEHFWYNSTGTTNWGTNGGITHDHNNGILKLKSNHQFQGNRILRAITGEPGYSQAYANYGVRMRIPKKAGPTGGGGLFFFGGDNGAGYYIEIMKSEIFDQPGGPQRNLHGNELGFFIRSPQAEFRRPVTPPPFQITADVWYDIDVEFREGAPSPMGDYTHDIRVYVNGQLAYSVSIPTGRVARSGKFGVWLRGNNSVEYEYLYAHDKVLDANNDDFSTYDRIKGGYASSMWNRQFVFGENMNNYLLYGKETSPQYTAQTKYYFEEFGPVVHEVREYDVSFEKNPVQHSRFYTSNASQIILPYYTGRSHGAKFMLANASRENAVANGEDLLTFGADNSVQQKTFIYGRLIYQEDEQTETVQDKDSIRASGRIENAFDSKWIQSKQEAERLGKWIVKHWGDGCDQISMTVFGNPLVQLSDVVTVNHPEMSLFGNSHRYVVVGINNNFDNGLSSQVTLRRLKI